MKKLLKVLKPRIYLLGARYFLFWARFTYKRWNPATIVVTGSVGKTVLLNMLEVQFKDKAHYTHNANSAYGIAFDMVGEKGITGSRLRWLYLLIAVPIKAMFVRRKQDFYIAELDADRPKEAGVVAKWMKPDTLLWVTLSRTHAVNFESAAKAQKKEVIDVIADAYSEIVAHTTGPVFVDAKDERMLDAASLQTDEVVPVQNAIKTYKVSKNSTQFVTSNGTFNFTEPMPREIGLQLSFIEDLMGLAGSKTTYDMASMQYPPGRSTYLEGVQGIGIIDSSYNAHLQSMQSVLGMFKSITHKHKWLVFGDIIEQGSHAKAESEQLAKIIQAQKLEKIILVGKRNKKELYPLLKDGSTPVVSFIEPREALDYIAASVSGDELLLFKGSQYLEGIIKHLLKDPEDELRLCRRGKKAQLNREQRNIG